jgi:hypothetical protein
VPIVAKKTFKNYAKDPAKFKADWTAVHDVVATEPAVLNLRVNGGTDQRENYPMFRFMFGIVSRSFDFEDFRRNWSKYKKMDDRVSATLQSDRDTLVAEQIQIFVAKYPWITARFNELANREDILGGLRAAALESNLLRKFREFSHWILLGIAFVQEKAPATHVWGQDERLPLSVAVCVLANPPYVVSNCQYIRDLCDFKFMRDLTIATMSVLCAVVIGALGVAQTPDICLKPC